MSTRVFVIMLVGVLWMWASNRAWPIAFVSQTSSKAHAVVISTELDNDEALKALSSTLMSDYGVHRDRLTWLKGSDATSARIEQAITEHMRELNSNDQFFIVIAMRMHAKGDDRILVTSDFEPAKPWSGFPTLTLRKLTAMTAGATVLILHPECPVRGGTQQPSIKMVQQVYGPSERQTRTMIGYCANSPTQTTAFVQNLDVALAELAKTPSTRAPWQSTNDSGLISVADVIDRLVMGEDGRDLAIEAGAGWLRVTGSPHGGDVTQSLAQLRAATDSTSARNALEKVVASALNASSLDSVNHGVFALSAYALDESKDEAWRTMAVQALGDLPPAASRPALEGLYANARSGAVRRSVLGEWHGISSDLEPMLIRDALDDDDPQVRVAAIQMLGLRNDIVSRVAIVHLLEDVGQDPQVRAASIRVLTSLTRPGDDSAPFLRALKDTDVAVRIEAASAVGRLPADAVAVRPLAEAFVDIDARVRESAAYALGRHWSVMDGTTAATVAQALVRRAGEEAGTPERVASLWALARGKRKEFTVKIAAILRSQAAIEVHLAAVDALEAIADPRGVPMLIKVAGEEGMEPRLLLAAIRALGLHDSRESVDALFSLAASSNRSVGEAAMAALVNLRTPSQVALALASRSTTEALLRLAAIDHLGRSDDRDSTKVLLGLLGSGDSVLSERAANALSMNGSVALVEKLGSLLEPNGNEEIHRIAAATALVGMNSDKARTHLAKYRNDSSEVVRLKVAESVDVNSLGSEALNTLLAMAVDQSASVRSRVAGKLGLINEPSSLQALRVMSVDGDASVRSVAIDGLRSLERETRMPTVNTEESILIYSYTRSRSSGVGRALRVDVFWCRGPGEEARSARARSMADELATLARSDKFAPAAIASIRVRPLSQVVNDASGYRLAGNQIRFEPDDAWERAWVDRFLALWGKDFVAHPVVNRTLDYMSFFYCGGST